VICDRCGRLLNRATGRCVCDDYGGVAPPPVATTHPPVNAAGSVPVPAAGVATATAPVAVPVAEAPASAAPAAFAASAVAPGPPAPAAPPPPISAAAAYAVLDLSDRPARPVRTPPPAPPKPVEPPPPPRAPGAAVGVLRGARVGRTKTDAVVYEGTLVLARRGASADLLAPQLAAQDPDSRVLDVKVVDDVAVREDALSGAATIRLRSGEVVVLRWPARKNRGVSGENLLAHAFPGTVDQGPSELTRRAIRSMVALGAGILVLALLWVGFSVVLRSDPPPPPPAAPAPTLPPAEQLARDELNAACPPWQALAAAVPAGERPDPVQLRPIVDGLRPRFDNAVAVGGHPSYAPARDEVAYLQDYARRSPEAVGLESVSRVAWAMRLVSEACTRAASAP
jgi:hypothetical protein